MDRKRMPRGEAQQQAYETLKEMIIVQQLQPNELVSEIKLAEKIKFGRSSIRTALQKLQADGLVTIYAQRGCRISEIDVVTQLKVLEVRGELERLMVTNAARRINDKAAVQLMSAAKSLCHAAQQQDVQSYMKSLRDLHDQTAEASENEILIRCVNQIQGLSRRFWYAHFERHADLNSAAELHRERVKAVCDGNPDAAAIASDRLVEYLADFTKRVVSEFPKSRSR